MAYAEAKLAYARERITELGSNFPPELHFLHPSKLQWACKPRSMQAVAFHQLCHVLGNGKH